MKIFFDTNVYVAHFSPRFASRSRRHVLRRSQLIGIPSSRHRVPKDIKDSPILVAALTAGVDYLVTNDRHLLSLDPYEDVRIISMSDYYDFLANEGMLPWRNIRIGISGC